MRKEQSNYREVWRKIKSKQVAAIAHVRSRLAELLSGQKKRPINYYLLPRITYRVNRADYQPVTSDRIADLVKEINKEKTDQVVAERVQKWKQVMAKVEQPPP